MTRAVGGDGSVRPLPGRRRHPVHALPQRRRGRRRRGRRSPTASPRAASATSASRARRCSRRWARTRNTRWRVSAGLSLPTGKNADRPFLGDKNVTGRIKAIGAAEFGKLRAAANLGILLRQTSNNFATELGHQLLYGAAAAYPVERRVDLMLEVFGRSGLNQFIELLLRRQPVRGQHRRPLHHQRHVVGHRRRRPRLRQRHRRARPAAVRDGRLLPRLPRSRQGRRLRRQRQVPGRARGPRRLPGQGRLPRSGQRRRQAARRQGQVPERGRGRRPVRGRGRLPGGRQRQGRHPRHSTTPARTPPRTARASGRRTAARRPPRTATATASPTPSTSARTSPRTATTSRTTTAAPIRTTTTTASPTTSTTARTTPRTPTASRTRTAAPIRTTTRTGSSTRSTAARSQAETLNGNKDDDGCPDPGAEVVRLGQDRIELDERIGFASRGGKLQVKESVGQVR